MAVKILLLGRKGIVVDDAKSRLNDLDLEIYAGTRIDDVRTTFSSHADVRHVFMSAGIDLETRLEIVREVFRLSDSTTVHMKDTTAGPQGFVPFIKAMFDGFKKDGIEICSFIERCTKIISI
ncbi:hypothetical protein MMC28_010833 [Mycoblastus sanguinarius]|nr:hypothetical protein [Mycoblastus sanguinarius]